MTGFSDKKIKNSADLEYVKAVNQLKRFLSESDISDEANDVNFRNELLQKANLSSSSDKSPNIVRKSLFKSPVYQKSKDQMAEEHLLLGLVQRQAVFINALEKELLFYQKEVPEIVNKSRILMSGEETTRICKSNNVAHKLFSLIDVISSSKPNSNHDGCEIQRKKLLTELSQAQRQIQQLNDQWTNHVCWNGTQPQPQFIEDMKRDKAEWTTTTNNLRSTIAALQQREADALRQVQQSVEVAEQAQEERSLMESQVRHLNSLVEQHDQQLSAINGDHSRRLQEERARLETKFTEQLNSTKRERDLRDEAVTRLSLDIEQLQRSEATLKNELRAKNNLLESSREDFQRQMNQMQNELNRSAGQQAELQRRLGEAELRSELNHKSAQQEIVLAKTETEFLRRKIDLLDKENQNQKQEHTKTIKELELRNMELQSTASHQEGEKLQADKSNSQTNALIKYLEQREISLLYSLQDEKKLHDSKCGELSSIIEEQRSILLNLRRKYQALIEDFEKFLQLNSSGHQETRREDSIQLGT